MGRGATPLPVCTRRGFTASRGCPYNVMGMSGALLVILCALVASLVESTPVVGDDYVSTATGAVSGTGSVVDPCLVIAYKVL